VGRGLLIVDPLDVGALSAGDGEAYAVGVGEDGPAVGEPEFQVVAFDVDVVGALVAGVDDGVAGHCHRLGG